MGNISSVQIADSVRNVSHVGFTSALIYYSAGFSQGAEELSLGQMLQDEVYGFSVMEIPEINYESINQLMLIW